MFGWKSRKTKIKEFANLWQQKLVEKQAALDVLKAIPDASERYVVLNDFRRDVTQEWNDGVNAYMDTSNVPTLTGISGGGLVGIGMVLAPTLIAAAPWIAVAGPFAIVAGLVTGAGAQKHRKKVLNNNIHDVTETLMAVLGDAEAAQQSIIDNDMASLTRSPKFGELCEKYPGIKDAFVKAAANSGFATDVLPHKMIKNRLAPPKQ